MKKNKIKLNYNLVDIVIPSKDRAMQLHLLLESVSKFVKGIGNITVSWQGSSPDYIASYELLIKRIMKDKKFFSLRKNSKKIEFVQRNNLIEVSNSIKNSGSSNYILILVDDDVFFKSIDFSKERSFHFFINNRDVHAYSIRLGDNLSSQLSQSDVSGIISEQTIGHAFSIYASGKPQLLYPVYSHKLGFSNFKEHKDYLVWAWPMNLHVPHWSLVFSSSGSIYRKKTYIKYLNKISLGDFLSLEGKGQEYFIKKFIGMSLIYWAFKFLDLIYMTLVRQKKIYNQNIFINLLVKYLYLKGKKINNDNNFGFKIVCSKNSVIVNLDAKVSHHRNGGFGQNFIRTMNDKYLKGKIIKHSEIPFSRIKFPTHVFQDFKFKNFN